MRKAHLSFSDFGKYNLMTPSESAQNGGQYCAMHNIVHG